MSASLVESSPQQNGVEGLRDIQRTKILATLGPASSSRAMMRQLMEAGASAFRINFSHGDYQQHQLLLDEIRRAEAELDQPVAVCADLCGPKIRVGMLQNGKVQLREGQTIVVQRSLIPGTSERISTTFPELVDAVRCGEKVLLADGRLQLEVVETAPPDHFVCQVIAGGALTEGKGVNLPSTNIPLCALTEKDRRDVQWIAERDFDYVALSFVQRADDIVQLRTLLDQRNCAARIIAKIEKPRALDHIDEIIDAADAVMVARGDLGVEMDLPAVPIAQKSITHKCQLAGKPCIIATEMLESMIHSPTPTRAEISDVANAVFDRTDAVMLSAESAIGEYPLETVSAMSRTVIAAEKYLDEDASPIQPTTGPPRTTAALASAIRYIMNMEEITAVAMYTDSGTTARLISKNRPACPILALAADPATVRRCCLYYGVISRHVDSPQDTFQLLKSATKRCQELGIAEPGDRIIVVAGHPIGVRDYTNGLIIEKVE